MSITMIGLDTAKSAFQVHAVDGAGKVLIRRVSRTELDPLFCRSRRPAPSSWKPAARRITGPGC